LEDSVISRKGTEGFRARIQLPVLLALFGIALIFRLSDLSARNLWTDEAWVALAALAPTPGEALALGRSTPPLYTLTLWVLAQFFGGSEAVLRSLSLVFGVGAVGLFWLTARRLVPGPPAFLGLALVAVSPVLVYFSKELKQYSGDAFFAVLVVYLAERLRFRPTRASWLALALAGTLALGFSHGAVFVLPVVLPVLWVAAPGAQRLRVACLGSLWGLAAVSCYVLFFRRQVDPELLAYWSGDFPDFSGFLPFLQWLGFALGRYFHYFFGDRGWMWGAPLTAAGLVALWRHGPRRLLSYLLGPLLLALGAAALHRYPFMGHYNGSRLLLFSAPFLYLIAASGLSAVSAQLWHSPRRWLAPVLAAFILITIQPVALIRENLSPQANRQELQPLAAYLQSHLLPGDLIYVYYHAVHPFKYYYRGKLEGVCWGQSCVETALAWPGGDAAIPRRVWLVAAHFQNLEELEQFAARLLGPGWRQGAVLTRRKAALFLYVHQDKPLAKSPVPPAATPQSEPAVPPPGRACGETPPPLRP